MVIYLHCVHALVSHIFLILFLRPDGMVVGHEKAIFSTYSDHIVYTVRIHRTFVVGFIFVKLHLIFILKSVTPNVFRAMPAYLLEIVLIKRHEAKVASLAVLTLFIIGSKRSHHLDLKAVKSKEVFVIQLVVSDENIVIGVGNDGIAAALVFILHLSGGKLCI